MLYLKIAGRVANSVDPDETPRPVASHLVYTVCSGLFVRMHTVNTICSMIMTLLGHLLNPESANHNNCRLLCLLLVILKVISSNSVDPDQTAPLGAV